MLTLFIGSYGCSEKARREHPKPPFTPTATRHVVLISVDTLRKDHLSLYGYPRSTSPHIDEFFAQGTVFENAFATAANTAPSVISMLTGQYPYEHRVRILFQLAPPELQLISDELPEHYETAAFVSNFVLTEEALGISDQFDYYDDFVDQKPTGRRSWERNAERTADAVIEWLRRRDDQANCPLFLWVHFMDPHGPYEPPEEWQRTFQHAGSRPLLKEKVPNLQMAPTITDALDYVDAYDEEIAYLDEHVGRLLRQTRQHLPDAETLYVLTADHGETMMEQELWFAHGYQVFDPITRIPLALRGPDFATRRVSTAVSLVDVAATVRSAFGVAKTSSGRDLKSNPESRILFSEATRDSHQWRVAIDGTHRWFAKATPESREVSESFYYDVASDPGQLNRMNWPPESEVSRRLLETFRDDPDPAGWPADLDPGKRLTGAKVHPRADREALEKLKSLGYVD